MAVRKSKTYVNDIGTKIIVDVKSDISTATIHELHVQKPVSGNVVVWPATIDPVNPNILTYIIVAGDLDEKGNYKVQPYVKLPDWEGRGETFTFTVFDRFA